MTLVRFQLLANAVAFVLLVALFAFNSAEADDSVSSDILEPGLGKSYVVGSKKAVTYFEKTDGSCFLTVMVGDMNPLKGGDYNYATRFQVSVEPGSKTAVDAAEGQSISFTCNSDAKSMDVNKAFLGPIPTAKRS